MNRQTVFAWLDRLYIALWRETPSEMGAWFAAEAAAGVERFGSGLGHLVVIEPKTPLPSPASRRELSDTLSRHRRAFEALALILEGQGFFLSTVASVATGIVMLTGDRLPTRTFRGPHDAAGFLSAHMRFFGGACDGEELAASIRLMREQWHTAAASSGARPAAIER